MRKRSAGVLLGLAGIGAAATGLGVAAASRPAPTGDPALPAPISVPTDGRTSTPATAPSFEDDGRTAQPPASSALPSPTPRPEVVDPPPAVDIAPAPTEDDDSADSPDDGDDD